MNENVFDNQVPIAWCPGCGNFGILRSLKKALLELGLKPEQVVISSGIGQAAKIPHYLKVNVFNGLHGRSIPAALAIKTVNPGLVVIAESGDGCMYGEGGNHFLHAIRRNPDITVIIHNNQVYGLTKGQASPTSPEGFPSKTQPFGSLAQPLNPLSLAISQGASFVARGFAGDPDKLAKILKEAITWRGLAIVDVLQPCVTFNKINTYDWYKKRVYYLPKNFDCGNKKEAFSKALEWGDKIPLGIFYKEQKPVFQEKLPFQKENLVYRKPRENAAEILEQELEAIK
ncbi:thiamine pyrophosphate-dependent enzyme [Thermatribacter velox]|jgi:2-oxoglutarate ferredoxin oxidoreductase subunit beta|uniref:Thiamine pyrophosphate-dependent enzyme n=1 Tax=Thermatribacter velox TaxID=3039681 RepID=A0ABZ2YE98_9BACT